MKITSVNATPVSILFREPEIIEMDQIKVRTKLGLGLELDREKMRKYNRAYREGGYPSAYDNNNVLEGKSFTLPNQ